jgi:hypothetical protein
VKYSSSKNAGWAKWRLASIVLSTMAALAIIVTALYDWSIGNKIGFSAARFGLFWLFGLAIFFRIATSMIFRKERKAFRARGEV